MICPACPPLVVYAAGSLLGRWRPEWQRWFWTGSLFLVPLALALFLLCRRSRWKVVPLLFCMVPLGALRVSLRLRPSFPPDHLVHCASGRPLLLEGVLIREPEVREAGSLLALQVRAIRSSKGALRTRGRAELWVPERVTGLRVGDILLAEARLKVPRRLGNPGAFDRKTRSFLAGTYVRGSVRDGRRLLRIGTAEGYRFARLVQGLRFHLAAFFEREEDPRVRGLLRAWFLGDRSAIPASLVEAFRSSGLAHLLAISGLHVGLVGLFWYGVLKALLRRSARLLLRFSAEKIALLGCLPIVLAYVFFVDSPVTAVRAVTMFALFAGSLLLDRSRSAWNALAVAGLLIILWDPAALFSVSFLLSFAAVAGLVAAASAWKPLTTGEAARKAGRGPSFWRLAKARAWRLITATLAATIVTAPLSAFFFNRVAPLGILANLLVVPVVGWFVIPLGFLTAMTALVCTGPAALLLTITSAGTKCVVAAVEAIATIPFADLQVGRPSFLEMAMCYLAVFGWFGIRKGPWRKRVVWVSLVILGCSVTASILRVRSDSRLVVTFLSVGQGDSMLVEFPGGRRMVVDGGFARKGYGDAGKDIVLPYLAYRRIRRLDYMAASHGQADHYGGLASVAARLHPAELWIGPERGCETEGYAKFLELCRCKGIRIRRFCRGREAVSIGGVRVEVLSPSCAGQETGINDQSLVMRLTFGKVSVLLTGDIEKKAESRLLADPSRVKALVLKVPHHGSRTSSSEAFLDAVAPAVAVVSAGYRNHFGFPSEEVVRRYRRKGILLYRTDLHGAVRLKTDGHAVWMETFLPLVSPAAPCPSGPGDRP